MTTKPKKVGRPKTSNKIMILQLPVRKEQLLELGGKKKAVKAIQYHLATITSERSQEVR